MPREPPVRSDNQHALLALAGGSREDAPGTDTIRDQVLKKKKNTVHTNKSEKKAPLKS